MRFVGTVEQVEGDRVKGFVERALFVNAPNLSPGGLQRLGQSVLALDLDPQNALHHHFGLSHALPGMGRTSLRNESWDQLVQPGYAVTARCLCTIRWLEMG